MLTKNTNSTKTLKKVAGKNKWHYSCYIVTLVTESFAFSYSCLGFSLFQMVADNGTNFPDATETLETFQWVTEGLLLMLVSTIGLIGNSCSVVTCARQRVQRIFHRLLLVLATFDTVSL